MNYIILTASAIESNRLQRERWIPSANLVPLAGLVRELRGDVTGRDLFYTDGALDALVRSAAVEGREWKLWREGNQRFNSVRPYEAWEYLHEASVEHLAGRNRARLALLSVVSHVPADRPTLSQLDLVNFERRHCAAAVKNKAADHLVRIAPGRIIVTEAQWGGVVEVRATWTALPAALRTAPGWLISGLDSKSMAGVE